MLVIWGSRLYGKVDEVPGLFHVATKFAHLWFIPLLPLGSTVVFSQTWRGWQGAPIGLNVKSVIWAWTQALLLILAVLLTTLGVLGVIAAGSAPPDKPSTMGFALALLFVGVGAGAGWFFLRRATWLTRASYERAHQLARRIGLNEEARVLIDVAYGVVTPAQAKAALAEFAEEEEEAQSDAADALAALGEAAEDSR